MTTDHCTRAVAEACDDSDLRLVKMLLGSPRLICGPCRKVLARAGAPFELVERRDEETRPFRPVWMRHLKGRDETGRIVA